jgi:hypothetical protein
MKSLTLRESIDGEMNIIIDEHGHHHELWFRLP